MGRRTMALSSIFSGIVSVAAALALVAAILVGPRPDPLMTLVALILCCVASAAMMIFLSLYVYLDAQSRGMKGALWAFLVLLFAGFPGFVVYLLVRPARRAA